MTAQAISTGTQQTAQAPRFLRAQLEFIGLSLPVTVWINPSWAFLMITPFLISSKLFGYVPGLHIVTIVALHILNSAAAILLYRAYRADSSDGNKWLRRFTMFQAANGFLWGATVLLAWQNGNPVNNVYVIIPVACLLWAFASTRAMHLGIYFAAVLPIVIVTTLRAALADGIVAHALAAVVPALFGYTLVLTLGAHRQFETMLVTRFANDDMTVDLRHAHDEALRKRFEAEAANASKTTFLANMSHELRTPLNAILGFSDIIANERLGEVGTKRYKEYAGDINASGSHLLSIINDILDIAKIESGKMEISPQILDPLAVIESAVTVVAGRARERRQTINIHIDDDTPMPYADERALKQIVINLASNAIKFTQEGGRIDIYGRGRDSGFELCVADNGPGISMEMLDRIFKPFNQIDNRYNRSAGGTGLGLSLVRGLAELHGGRAWMESDVGQGARAYVYFPVANAPVKRALDRAHG
jgi:two-component system cell cycle sensor histidine kinase PleC